MSDPCQRKSAEASKAPAPADPKRRPEPEPPPRGGPTAKLFARAHDGEETCLPELRALMDHPERGDRVVEFYGDQSVWAEDAAVKMVAGNNLGIREALPRKLKKLREELEGPEPNVIERLLAERVAYCWMILQEVEQNFALALKQLTPRQELHYHKRVDAAHRRYLSTLRALAQVRKLSIPAIQVNVAESQVNIAKR